MKILIIGLGHTGEGIATKLKKTGHEIYFISRNPPPHVPFKRVTPKTCPKDLDYVIISLSCITYEERKSLCKEVKTDYELRLAELEGNIRAVNEYLPLLKSLPQKTRILVVSNPVDELTTFLSEHLPSEEILGFGMQSDVKRFSELIGKKIFCIGLHGNAIPLLNSKSKDEYNTLRKELGDALFNFVRKNGIPYKKTSESFIEFFNKLNSKEQSTVYASYYLKDEFFGIKDIAISLPLIFNNGKIIKIADVHLNTLEKNLLKKEVKEMKKRLSRLQS